MPAQSPNNLLSFIRKVNVLKIFSNSLLLLPLIVFELPAKANFEDCYNGVIHRDNHTYVKLVCQCVTSISINQIFPDLANRMRYCVNEYISYSNNYRQQPVQQSPVIILPGLTDFQGSHRNQQLMIESIRSFRPGRAVN